MAGRFRTLYKWLVPSWLSEGEGGMLLHSMAIIKDAFDEKLRQGLNARFPTRSAPDALALTGSDRGIIQGRAETNEHYAERLTSWRYPRGHRARGSAWMLLEQIGEYSGAHCYTIDASGNVYERAVDGTESHSTGAAWNWDSDNGWSRFWVVLDPGNEWPMSVQPALDDPALWGGELGLPGYTVGQIGALPAEVVALRRLMRGRAWKPAGSRAEWIVVSLDGSFPSPPGNWARWSEQVDDVQTPVRGVYPALVRELSTEDEIDGAGTLVCPYPAFNEGDLLVFHEGRASAFADAAPADWTLIATKVGSFSIGQKVYAQIAGDPSGYPSGLNYAVTGSDDHVGIITAYAPPPGGWSATVADNFADITTASGTSTTANDPDNAAGTHRLLFYAFDFFDLDETVSGSAYTEAYDVGAAFNLSLSESKAEVTGSVSTFPVAAVWSQIALTLNYNPAPYRFWSLDPKYNNSPTGDPTLFPLATQLVDGAEYAGDPTNFPDGDQALPGGGSYRETPGYSLHGCYC